RLELRPDAPPRGAMAAEAADPADTHVVVEHRLFLAEGMVHAVERLAARALVRDRRAAVLDAAGAGCIARLRPAAVLEVYGEIGPFRLADLTAADLLTVRRHRAVLSTKGATTVLADAGRGVAADPLKEAKL